MMLPFLYHGTRGGDDEWERQDYYDVVKKLVEALIEEMGDVTDSMTYYVVQEMMPVVVDGLQELAHSKEYYGKAPLEFLGGFLMRNNPKHPQALLDKGSRMRRRMLEKRYLVCCDVVAEIYAEIASQQKFDALERVWETPEGVKLMELWHRQQQDYMTLDDIIANFGEFSSCFKGSSPEDLFCKLTSKRVISFEQYYRGVGQLLQQAKILHKIEPTTRRKQNNKNLELIKGKAFETLQKRLATYDPQLWYDQYLLTNDLSLTSARFCQQHHLNLDPHHFNQLKSGEEQTVSYERFVRIMADFVRISNQNDEKKIRVLRQNTTQRIRKYLRNIDQAQYRLNKLKSPTNDKTTHHKIKMARQMTFKEDENVANLVQQIEDEISFLERQHHEQQQRQKDIVQMIQEEEAETEEVNVITPPPPAAIEVLEKKSKKKKVKVRKGDVSQAVKAQDPEKLRELFQALKTREIQAQAANEKDKNFSTPLMHAAWVGDVETAAILLEFGGNPLQTNLRLNTPMHFAFERNHVEFAKLILKHAGPKALHCKNALGKTPLQLNPMMQNSF